MIEEVAKILNDYFPYLGKKDRRNEAIYQLCQLFEPKFNNALEADAHNWDTRELLEPIELKPDEGRLLTGDEIIQAQEDYIKDTYQRVGVVLSYPLRGWRRDDCFLQAQRDLTASIKKAEFAKTLGDAVRAWHKRLTEKDAECQERVERIFKEVGEWLDSFIKTKAGKWRGMWIMQEDIETFKRGEMPNDT